MYIMDVVEGILAETAREAEKYKPITVDKHLELEIDVGTLLAIDNNELDAKRLGQKRNDYIKELTRDDVQLLLNKVWDLPSERVEEAIVVKLPSSTFSLPRSKPVPKPKAPTKWQQFAKLKGIQKKNKPKLSWDEQLKKWIPLYGYKRAIATKEKEWVLEVPANSDPMEDQFEKVNATKGERVAKNELQRLRNIAKARNVKVPKLGLPSSEVASAKDLEAAITVARASTASLGKFQDKLPMEKEARGIGDMVPGATRKRKLPPVSGSQEKTETLVIIDSILNKKPKLDIEKAVNRHINLEKLGRSEEKNSEKPKAGKRFKTKSGKKPSSGKGQRKGKGANFGRKRR